jgi:hypothetical protein
MRLIRRDSFLAVLAVSFAVPMTGAGAALARQDQTACVPIRATGVGQDLGGGKTEATISVSGITLGHTDASFATTGLAGTVASFAGPIVFTSTAGTLTAQATGTLDVTTGGFQTRSTDITGTGLFRRTTGAVTLVGMENLTTGSFRETITGRLCEPTR